MVKHNKGDRQSRNEGHTFVLVHGGWSGGWLWRYVAPALRERGHVVTTPTLTGLGERRHLGNETATLSTHIEDIVAHIEMEGFQDVTLVSHSYGGMVATGTLARIPDSIRSMIHLDAFVPEDGKSLIDCCSPERQAQYMIYKGEDRPVPPLPLSYFGITDPALVDFITPKLVNQPWRTFFEPVKVIPRPSHVRMSYVRCFSCQPSVVGFRRKRFSDCVWAFAQESANDLRFRCKNPGQPTMSGLLNRSRSAICYLLFAVGALAIPAGATEWRNRHPERGWYQ
jgi:pimeloyl-ACP methyl ester carboxylesterase